MTSFFGRSGVKVKVIFQSRVFTLNSGITHEGISYFSRIFYLNFLFISYIYLQYTGPKMIHTYILMIFYFSLKMYLHIVNLEQ